MSKFERIRSVLNGEQPDRLPYSFWHHYPEDAREGRSAIAAHVNHYFRYDVDFVKVMNDLAYPVPRHSRDHEFNPKLFSVLQGDESTFGKHLDVLSGLAKILGQDVPLMTTVFGPWTVLRRHLMEAHLNVRGVPQFGLPVAAVDLQINQLINDRPQVMGEVFRKIATSQANFARRCLKAGASGIYFSVRKDWPNLAGAVNTYDDFVLPFDQICLEGAEDGWLNLLHLCGEFESLSEFASLPSQIVHWADRQTGPSLLEASHSGQTRAVCGGIDNFNAIASVDTTKLAAEISEVLQLGAKTPLLLAPGCAYDAKLVPETNLQMIREMATQTPSSLLSKLALSPIEETRREASF